MCREVQSQGKIQSETRIMLAMRSPTVLQTIKDDVRMGKQSWDVQEGSVLTGVGYFATMISVPFAGFSDSGP